MNAYTIDVLSEIGLSRNEAIVYLANLELGATTVLKLAQKADIKRSTIYPLLHSLMEKGLVNIQTKGAKKLYAAESPEKIDLFLEEQKHKFLQILPALSDIKTTEANEQALIRHYHGIDTIKILLTSSLAQLSPNDEILLVINGHHQEHYFSDFFLKLANSALKLNLDVRVLMHNLAFYSNPSPFPSTHFKIRYFHETSQLPNCFITPHKILLTQTETPYLAVSMEIPCFASMFHLLFESLWERNEKTNGHLAGISDSFASRAC